MSRYIDAEEFKRHTIKFGEEQNSQELANWLCQYIDCFSTADVVPVVRCRDCKYYKFKTRSIAWNTTTKCCCRTVNVKVNEDDYCSYGERREG
jgi:hypothetical protein